MSIAAHHALPVPEVLKGILRSQAALDIILVEGHEEYLRLHHFHRNVSDGTDMVKIDNGSGDHMYILFHEAGAVMKGFDHESALSPYANEEETVAPGIYEDVPGDLLALLGEETEREDVTFCLWRTPTDTAWKKGNVVIPEDEDDGEGFLLGLIFIDADAWLEWAKDYYEMAEREGQLEAVASIYRLEPVTAAIIAALNPDRDSVSALEELEAIGYPVA